MTGRMSSGVWIVLTAAAIVSATSPQARADQKVVARVPFAFVAGGTLLPAGNYVITETENQGIMLVQDTARRHAAFVLTIADLTDRPADPALMFQRDGDHYVLVRVSEGGTDQREVFVVSRSGERDTKVVSVPADPVSVAFLCALRAPA